jgi:hypothetical protein
MREVMIQTAFDNDGRVLSRWDAVKGGYLARRTDPSGLDILDHRINAIMSLWLVWWPVLLVLLKV